MIIIDVIGRNPPDLKNMQTEIGSQSASNKSCKIYRRLEGWVLSLHLPVEEKETVTAMTVVMMIMTMMMYG